MTQNIALLYEAFSLDNRSWLPQQPLPQVTPHFDEQPPVTQSVAQLYESFGLDQLFAWSQPGPLPQTSSRLRYGGASPVVPLPVPKNAANAPGRVTSFGATPVYTVPGAGISGAVGGVWPQAGAVSEVFVGGTAVAAVIGPCNGGYVTNPTSATGQGLGSTENMYIDLVNPPGSTDATGNGTTVIVTPGQNFTVPALATGAVVWVNATSSGHKFSVVVW